MIHILKIILNSHKKKINAFLLSENNIFHIILNLPKYHNNSRYVYHLCINYMIIIVMC